MFAYYKWQQFKPLQDYHRPHELMSNTVYMTTCKKGTKCTQCSFVTTPLVRGKLLGFYFSISKKLTKIIFILFVCLFVSH